MNRINVTEPYLPPYKDYEKYLKKIWQTHYLTNQGPLLKDLENQLVKYLGVSNLHFLTNGTIALQVALEALGIRGADVITTPFSYVATTSALLWESCRPIFVDIEPETFCIDLSKIEAAITPNTKAILAVHVFGFPCQVQEIEKIAAQHKLKVIYDGAHAFGAEYNNKSLLSFGDITMCSFHATKLFHTIEGGCLIANDESISNKIELIKRFGHNGDDHLMLGLNAKASEFQAAMGLSILPHVSELIKTRKKIASVYDGLLSDNIYKPEVKGNFKPNYAYYPIVFQSETKLLKSVKRLNDKNIFPRRYFYPSLNKIPYIKDPGKYPISDDIAKRILCLPLYPGLKVKDAQKIAKLVGR